MHKIFRLIFLIMSLSPILLLEKAYAEKPDQIIVALNQKPSFPNRGRVGTEQSQNPGVAFETLQLVEKRIGIPIKFKRFPYKRCLLSMQSGKVDAVMTGSYKAEREQQGVYPRKNNRIDISRRVYNSSYYLYILKDSKVQWNGSAFENLNGPIGVELGFSIIDSLKKWGADVITFTGPEACFKFLAHFDRLSGVAAHDSTGGRFLYQYKNLKRLPTPLETKAYYLLFSHQFYNAYPELSEKIWDKIAELRESTQEWQDLKEKYFSLKIWDEGP